MGRTISIHVLSGNQLAVIGALMRGATVILGVPAYDFARSELKVLLPALRSARLNPSWHESRSTLEVATGGKLRVFAETAHDARLTRGYSVPIVWVPYGAGQFEFADALRRCVEPGGTLLEW